MKKYKPKKLRAKNENRDAKLEQRRNDWRQLYANTKTAKKC